jgi:hypothetical protein
MKEIRKEKAFWRKYFNYASRPEDLPPAMAHVNFRCTEVNDEAVGFLASRIKSIERLDLDESCISNNAIKQLASFQYIKELRLKDNYSITNDCIPDLAKLVSLELLHLGSTSVTIDGILKLTSLKGLRLLLFSAPPEGIPDEKIMQLKALFPTCEIVVNNQPV